MSTPVLENIAANIETAVNAITTGNGFNYTLNAIRPRRVMFLDTELKEENELSIFPPVEGA